MDSDLLKPPRVSGNIITQRVGYTTIEKSLYCPLQPAVTNQGEVTYREFFPSQDLQRYIYCYWQLKTTQALPYAFSYRVVADGCIDIAFNMKRLDESIVMGFCNTFHQFSLEPEFNYVGIRFLPAMFPRVFNIDASELTNCMRTLEDVLPTTARFIMDYLHPEYSMYQVAQVFDLYFAAQFSNRKHHTDQRFFNALQYILKKQGVLRIENDIDVGLSARQMRRLFDFYVGDSPKSFAKVVRFQNFLQAKPTFESLRQSKSFFDSGYYDQAHFIKEFRDLYGVTPSKALRG